MAGTMPPTRSPALRGAWPLSPEQPSRRWPGLASLPSPADDKEQPESHSPACRHPRPPGGGGNQESGAARPLTIQPLVGGRKDIHLRSSRRTDATEAPRLSRPHLREVRGSAMNPAVKARDLTVPPDLFLSLFLRVLTIPAPSEFGMNHASRAISPFLCPCCALAKSTEPLI